MNRHRKMITLLLSLSFAFTASSALAAPVAEERTFLNEGYYEAQIRKELTEKIARQDLPAIKEVVLQYFPTKEDKAYFEKLEKNYKPQKLHFSASEARGQTSIFGDGVDILLSHFDRGQQSFKINGANFQFAKGKSLEFHTQKMVALLTKKNSAKSLNSLWFENAQAEEPSTSWLAESTRAVFNYFPKAIIDLNTYSLQKDLERLQELCEKRDPTIPYERSVALTTLTFMAQKRSFEIEEQRKITDCDAWVKKDSRLNDLGRVRLETLCKTGGKALRCMDEYKAESEKKSPVDAPKLKDKKKQGTAK